MVLLQIILDSNNAMADASFLNDTDQHQMCFKDSTGIGDEVHKWRLSIWNKEMVPSLLFIVGIGGK